MYLLLVMPTCMMSGARMMECIPVHACTRDHINMHTHDYINMHTYDHINIHTPTHTYTHTNASTFICALMQGLECECIRIHVPSHAYYLINFVCLYMLSGPLRVCFGYSSVADTCSHLCACVCSHMCVCVFINSLKQATYVSVFSRNLKQATCVRAYNHMCACV